MITFYKCEEWGYEEEWEQKEEERVEGRVEGGRGKRRRGRWGGKREEEEGEEKEERISKPSSLLEGALCSLHGCFHLVFSTVRNVQVYLPRGGVVAVDVTAAWHKLPIDEVLEHLYRRHVLPWFLMLGLEIRSETATKK